LAEKFHTWAPILIVVLLPVGAFAQGRIPEFRSRFARDTDPIHRARMMPQLEEAEFEALAKSADDGKLPEALAILQEFRDQAESCEKGLDAKNINAEKHPNGFKQLQLALRESMRHLDALLVSFTADEQTPFLKLRGELDRLDRHVIRELFPNRPNNEPDTEPSDTPNNVPDNAPNNDPSDGPSDAPSHDTPLPNRSSYALP
jgi:hypothetical protein